MTKIYVDSYIGTFSISLLSELRADFKRIGLKVKFRGRGKRTNILNHKSESAWKTDLPLSFAERAAVYEI